MLWNARSPAAWNDLWIPAWNDIWHFQSLAQHMPCSLWRPRTFCPVTAVCCVDHCRCVVLIATDTQTETERLKLINLFNAELSPERYSARGLTDPSRWREWGWGEVGGGGTIPKEVTLIWLLEWLGIKTTAMRAIFYVSLIMRGSVTRQCSEVSHSFWRERRARAESNRGSPCA